MEEVKSEEEYRGYKIEELKITSSGGHAGQVGPLEYSRFRISRRGSDGVQQIVDHAISAEQAKAKIDALIDKK